MHGHVDVVQFLLENGANTELCDDWNCTALHNAAGAGHYQIVDLLCNAGARLDARASNKGNLLNRVPLRFILLNLYYKPHRCNGYGTFLSKF